MSLPVQTPLSDRLFKVIHYAYHGFFEEVGDPRVANYPLMGSGPWSTLALVAMYLYVVKILGNFRFLFASVGHDSASLTARSFSFERNRTGPNIMRDRKPLDLKNVMIAYNFLMVLASGWMFLEGCLLTNFGFDLWSCQVVDNR
jgi:hypothetical protein